MSVLTLTSPRRLNFVGDNAEYACARAGQQVVLALLPVSQCLKVDPLWLCSSHALGTHRTIDKVRYLLLLLLHVSTSIRDLLRKNTMHSSSFAILQEHIKAKALALGCRRIQERIWDHWIWKDRDGIPSPLSD